MTKPKSIKTVVCNVCGELCAPMTYGDNHYFVGYGYASVSVCYDCDKRYGEEAYRRALQNTK